MRKLLAIYSFHGNHVSRIRLALPPKVSVIAAGDWRAFCEAAPAASCSVVALDWLGDGAAFRRLSDFRARLPAHPAVLITRRDPDNARCLKDISFEEVVWLDEVEQTLWPAISAAAANCLLHRLAVAFERADHLPPVVRALLSYPCRCVLPVRSVAELAEAMGCNRRTLWHRWRRALGPSAPLRLEDFLHWLLLLRAAGHKVPSRAWTRVADELGVREERLGRLAQKLAGLSLRDLGELGQSALLERFTCAVVSPLLGEAALGQIGLSLDVLPLSKTQART